MPLKDLLKKKEKIKASDTEPISPPPSSQDPDLPPKPEFTFLRSDTNTQELISPPAYPDEQTAPETAAQHATEEKPQGNRFSKRFSRLSNHSSSPSKEKEKEKEKDATSRSPPTSRPASKDKDSRRLSQRLHISPRSRNTSQSSTNIPSDLPEIGTLALGTGQQNEEKQAAWEERATILVKDNPNNRPLSRPSSQHRSSTNFSRPTTPNKPVTQPDFHLAHLGDRAPRGRSISDAKSDDDIQAAIRLHESGNLVESTAMFGRLADNKSNAMAQILYGLALRHGWGIEPDPGLGITYLSRAATMSADVESDALAKGVKKGGAAKGELVLAIYELANSFRHGWGAEKDPVAARKYYEVAANLGDTDAMNECGWCYDEGYGGKKDRYTAAQYYRLAEQQGSKTLGNSWIWKDKYDPDNPGNVGGKGGKKGTGGSPRA